ncbi:hypothetical protein GQ53DRAFT_518707 [Thozetella sp. PMI_491]|nr:hypothetical protein GQ53DRAFT_518707 [Thozetella sp. PMI_491]
MVASKRDPPVFFLSTLLRYLSHLTGPLLFIFLPFILVRNRIDTTLLSVADPAKTRFRNLRIAQFFTSLLLLLRLSALLSLNFLPSSELPEALPSTGWARMNLSRHRLALLSMIGSFEDVDCATAPHRLCPGLSTHNYAPPCMSTALSSGFQRGCFTYLMPGGRVCCSHLESGGCCSSPVRCKGYTSIVLCSWDCIHGWFTMGRIPILASFSLIFP